MLAFIHQDKGVPVQEGHQRDEDARSAELPQAAAERRKACGGQQREGAQDGEHAPQDDGDERDHALRDGNAEPFSHGSSVHQRVEDADHDGDGQQPQGAFQKVAQGKARQADDADREQEERQEPCDFLRRPGKNADLIDEESSDFNAGVQTVDTGISAGKPIHLAELPRGVRKQWHGEGQRGQRLCGFLPNRKPAAKIRAAMITLPSTPAMLVSGLTMEEEASVSAVFAPSLAGKA